MAAELNRVVEHVRSVLVKQGTDAMTDGDLVKRYREQRDDVAFEALVRRHGPMVMGVCRRVLRNLHDAEDAFQANFQVFGNGRVAGSPDVVLGNPNTTNIAFWFGRTRLSDIRDGTSNTIMFAEKIAQCGQWLAPVDGASLWSCEFNQRRPGFAINGAAANSTGPGSLFQVGADPATCDWNLASTASRTAILVALCDGSVRSLAATIAPAIWWSALQPNDGGNLGDW